MAVIACNGDLSILESEDSLPPWALNVYTDAANPDDNLGHRLLKCSCTWPPAGAGAPLQP